MKQHTPECRWEKTTEQECEYKATHYFCPHDGCHGEPDHSCNCAGVRPIRELGGYTEAEYSIQEQLMNGVLKDMEYEKAINIAHIASTTATGVFSAVHRDQIREVLINLARTKTEEFVRVSGLGSERFLPLTLSEITEALGLESYDERGKFQDKP